MRNFPLTDKVLINLRMKYLGEILNNNIKSRLSFNRL